MHPNYAVWVGPNRMYFGRDKNKATEDFERAVANNPGVRVELRMEGDLLRDNRPAPTLDDFAKRLTEARAAASTARLDYVRALHAAGWEHLATDTCPTVAIYTQEADAAACTEAADGKGPLGSFDMEAFRAAIKALPDDRKRLVPF